ncbi:MAG: hypothetical protein Q7J42_06455 [Sulfuritalea sp.]|nr:hypothetical protein [Sulfuritalea sp.]
MAVRPVHVHADDLLEVIVGFADIDVAAKEIGVVLPGFRLLQQPVDVGVGNFKCVSDWTVGIPAYADKYGRLIL